MQLVTLLMETSYECTKKEITKTNKAGEFALLRKDEIIWQISGLDFEGITESVF